MPTTGSDDLGRLARELDELRRSLGRHDDAQESAQLTELGESVRRISAQLRERAALLSSDVVGHGRPTTP